MYSLDEEEERKAVTGLSAYGSQPLRNPPVIGIILFGEPVKGILEEKPSGERSNSSE